MPQRGQWKGLRSIICVESRRASKNENSFQRRYFISSLPADWERLARTIRQHWRIENTLHWCLDMTFDEDHSRIRQRVAAQNIALLRKVALSWLKQEPTKRSIRAKRKMIGWDNRFIAKTLLN